MEVWHTGVTSPIIMAEVTLTAHIIQAWSLNCPLGVTETIELMNSLISETRHETMLIEWKTKRGILNPDPDVPLLGWSWWEGFKRRNPELETKAGRKWPRNRADHCHSPYNSDDESDADDE